MGEHGPEEGRRLFERWADRFPDYYKAATRASTAAADVARFEELEGGDRPFLIALSNQTHEGETLTHVRVYKGGGKVELSDFVPTLESLGLRVVDEWPTTLQGDDGWTLLTSDGGAVAQFEHTVVVTSSGPLVLTAAA